ncbi:hypothetical protein PV726_41365 [Streptomyces europaeiscabiei]|uniref:hypothetical protein n=1 Tax=Streptomyces europaeiscabiei TaxID=146819 RepID=UPI0029A99329|nr:hypothetical protein [Streptomyces europaeiscabiei]MDX3696602.1 hypothetical protein [Streptomyces europaeiscabiei]
MPKGAASTFKGRAQFVLALASAWLLATASVAWATPVTDNIVPVGGFGAPMCSNDPDGGDGTVDCLTDNSDVYYYMDSSGEYELESEDRTVVTGTLHDEYSPTDLAIHYDSTPVFSGSGETDIVYQEGSTNLDADSDGVTWCNDSGEGSGTYAVWECDQQYVRIRGNGHYTYGLTCHETGHAVGLVHGYDASPALNNGTNSLGCMTTPVETFDLGASNTESINDVYPAA